MQLGPGCGSGRRRGPRMRSESPMTVRGSSWWWRATRSLKCGFVGWRACHGTRRPALLILTARPPQRRGASGAKREVLAGRIVPSAHTRRAVAVACVAREGSLAPWTLCCALQLLAATDGWLLQGWRSRGRLQYLAGRGAACELRTKLTG